MCTCCVDRRDRKIFQAHRPFYRLARSLAFYRGWLSVRSVGKIFLKSHVRFGCSTPFEYLFTGLHRRIQKFVVIADKVVENKVTKEAINSRVSHIRRSTGNSVIQRYRFLESQLIPR